MKKEYKAVVLTYGHSMNLLEEGKLNTLFSEGWEYVDSIAQSNANNGSEYGPVMVILKKVSETSEILNG